MRLHKDGPENFTNSIKVFGADGEQLGCVRSVDLVTHEYEQVVLGEPELVQEGSKEHYEMMEGLEEFRPLLVSTSIRRPLVNPDGTLKMRTGTYARIEIVPRPAQQG